MWAQHVSDLCLLCCCQQVPVPMFLPTTLESADKIVETIEELKVKIPSNPLEADILAMAEMIAEAEELDKASSDPCGRFCRGSGWHRQGLPAPETRTSAQTAAPPKPLRRSRVEQTLSCCCGSTRRGELQQGAVSATVCFGSASLGTRPLVYSHGCSGSYLQ